MESLPTYRSGTVRALLETDLVTPPTRRALRERLDRVSAPVPMCFDAHAFATLEAVCARLVPQAASSRRVEIASELDRRVAEDSGDGWRYAGMPVDLEMHRRGLAGLDEAAMAVADVSFVALDGARQDLVLLTVQKGCVVGASWAGMSPVCYFEELLTQVVDIYYAHPLGQDEIGYVGFADALGWSAIGLDEREEHEPPGELPKAQVA